jgi:uncharacterized protein
MGQSRTGNKLALSVLASIAFCVFLPATSAQTGSDVLNRFEKTETMIPTRDGVRLHTLIYVPKNSREPLPFIMLRTPYGIDGRAAGAFNNYFKDLVADGYIFVFQDIRGRFKSEGQFVIRVRDRLAR